MQVIQSAAKLHAPLEQFVSGELPAGLYQVSQRFARDIAHDGKNAVLCFKEVQDLRQIGMRQVFEDVHFLPVAQRRSARIVDFFQHDHFM